MRHAEASLTQSLDGSDRGRILTKRGLAQGIAMGKALRSQEVKPELILCSPYHRTSETASLISEHSGIKVVCTAHWLASGMFYTTALEELAVYREFTSIAIVGHQPDLGYLLEYLSSEHTTFAVEQGSMFKTHGSLSRGKCVVQRILP